MKLEIEEEAKRLGNKIKKHKGWNDKKLPSTTATQRVCIAVTFAQLSLLRYKRKWVVLHKHTSPSLT